MPMFTRAPFGAVVLSVADAPTPKTRWSPQRTPPPIISPTSKWVRGPVQ